MKRAAKTIASIKALILDLDDTIFCTKSMDANVFTPFFDRLTLSLSAGFGQDTIDSILSDLWCSTWDKVMDKYGIPQALMQDAIDVLDKLELELLISPYSDYHVLSRIDYPKFLVTTSVTSIQERKIAALGIAADFTKIVINDPFRIRQTKLDIFRQLMDEFSLPAPSTYVIGDNYESEIAAGNTLGMVTVQILRPGVAKGNNANHYISSFEELLPILSEI